MFQANTHTLLCRTPVTGSDDDSLQEEVEAVVNGIVEHSLPATEQCLHMHRNKTWCVSRLLNIAEKADQGKKLVRPDIALEGARLIDSVQPAVVV